MRRWLLLIHKLPAVPSAPRVAVWRALRRTKGHYLVDGVFVIPYSKLARLDLLNMAHDIGNYGGRAAVLTVVNEDLGDLRAAWKLRSVTRPKRRARTA